MKNTKICSTISDSEICKKLQLSSITLDILHDGGEKANVLREALIQEVMFKRSKRARVLAQNAHFPNLKTFDDYDFEHVEFPNSVSSNYFTGTQFITDKHGLFLFGQPGTGKTHFSIASGIVACKAGMRVRFWRAYDLSEAMKRAAGRNELEKFLKDSRRYELSIIDEFGFYPTDAESMRLFFEYFSASVYERQAFILTSNLDFTEWIDRSAEPKMAEAVIDRIAHVSHLLKFSGESVRFENSQMRKDKKKSA